MDDSEDAWVAYTEDIRDHYLRDDLESDPQYADYLARLAEQPKEPSMTESKVQYISRFKQEPLPGIELLTTDAAREVADRAQFEGGIGQHVYVNGYDLARVEAAGLRDPDLLEALADHGYRNLSGDMLFWFRDADTNYQKYTLAQAVLAVIRDLTARLAEQPKERG